MAPSDQVAIGGEADVARRLTGIILPNVLIRRSAFEQSGGFSPVLRLAEDLDLILTLSRRGGFVFTPDVLVDYRTHANNTSGRYRELCRSIDMVVRMHRWSARERGDRAAVAAYHESLCANQRYAWWSALRSARGNSAARHPAAAARDILWAMRFAPGGPPSALLRRFRRRR